MTLMPTRLTDLSESLSESIGWRLDNRYTNAMSGGYTQTQAACAPDPRLMLLNQELAHTLGLDLSTTEDHKVLASLFSGNTPPAGAFPVAQAYAGHQFGQFVPKLGDGRALLWGEHTAPDGSLFDIALKGAGPTPFARGGDGFAALGPMLREYLMGEAMHALGIPSTRALAVVSTGRTILRQQVLTGAVLTRVALSHIRVGTFQYFAARGDTASLHRLAQFAIARHDPALLQQYSNADPALYLKWFNAVLQRQAALVAQWLQVGFIHGVMNTDNMTLSGQTIDYGPCAWMDVYHPDTCFSSIDQYKRYAFARQPSIAAWNLARFAESLLPLLETIGMQQQAAITHLQDHLAGFEEYFEGYYLQGMRNKLGLTKTQPEDAQLLEQLLTILQEQKADYTLSLRYLSDAAMGHEQKWLALLQSTQAGQPWLAAWRARWQHEGNNMHAVANQIKANNPLYIPRNHLVESALVQAENGDIGACKHLLQVLQQPFTERAGLEQYTQPAPPSFVADYKTFCGT